MSSVPVYREIMPPARRSLFTVYLLIGFALVAGGTAALLTGLAPARPVVSGQLILDFPPQVWGILFLSPFLVGIAAAVLQRLVNQRRGIPNRALVTFGVMILLAILFMALAHGGGASDAGSVTYVSSGGGGNTSSGGSGGNYSAGNGSGAVGPAPAFSVSLPGWVPFAVIGVVSACVAVVAIPGLAARIGRRGSESGLGGTGLVPRQAVRADLARASAEIDEGVDPRVAIVRLYARLLARVEPIVGELGSRTAEEIRSIYLGELGVRPQASEALTRLFEEARYSEHPMGPEAAERARRAIGLVEADLTAGSVAS